MINKVRKKIIILSVVVIFFGTSIWPNIYGYDIENENHQTINSKLMDDEIIKSPNLADWWTTT